jgi:PEP-CTERM motif
MTKSTFSLKVLSICLLVLAGSASAATYTNTPSGGTNSLPFVSFGNAPNPSGDSPAAGEVFKLTVAEQLASFSFYAIGNRTLSSLRLNLATWNAGGNATGTLSNNAVGAPLLTVTGATSQTFSSASGVTTWKFDNLGLNLNANIAYVAYLTSPDSTLTGVSLARTQTTQDASGFGIGTAYLSTIPGNGWQFPFNGNGFLSLQYTAVTSPVPEPETFAMLLAGIGLVGFMTRRKARA